MDSYIAIQQRWCAEIAQMEKVTREQAKRLHRYFKRDEVKNGEKNS